jgi:hypothetical protein
MGIKLLDTTMTEAGRGHSQRDITSLCGEINMWMAHVTTKQDCEKNIFANNIDLVLHLCMTQRILCRGTLKER